MATIQERIKELRIEKGYTQEELAKLLDLNSKSNIANYENGANSPSDKVKLKMCKLFNCSMDYLMGKSDYKTADEKFEHYKKSVFNTSIIDIIPALLKMGISQKEILDLANTFALNDNNKILLKINQIKSHIPDNQKNKFDSAIELFIDNVKYKLEFDSLKAFKENNSKYYMCPVYGQISAGQPNWAEECINSYLPIDPDLMGIVNPQEHFFLRVNGESMNNVVKNGAFALIHKQDIVEDGEIAVVLVNGYDATLKRFTKKGDVVVLEPDSNDSSFKTQIYDKTTPIKILGKYVGKMEINK